MPNCAVYVLPGAGQRNGFLEDGSYTFIYGYEVHRPGGDQNSGNYETEPIVWSASDQTIDNAIKDSAISAIQAEINVTVTRNDIKIFR